jgi:hypothetical protein
MDGPEGPSYLKTHDAFGEVDDAETLPRLGSNNFPIACQPIQTPAEKIKKRTGMC